MNSSDPRTVTAVVKRERARNRLRAVTAGTGVLGLAVAGGLAFTLPSSTHSASSTPAKSGSGSSATHATLGDSSTSSSSSGTSGSSSGTIGASSSAPSSSSGSAHATSGGS